MANSSNKNAAMVTNQPQQLSGSVKKSVKGRIDPQTVLFEVPFSPPKSKGTEYKIIVTNEMDEYDKPVPLSNLLSTSPAILATVSGDSFSGTSRKAAKISISAAPTETFSDLRDLIASLPSIQTMVNHHPPITVSSNSKRVAEEERNVKLRVWLYAASRENDNDFHLILGRAPGMTPKIYMTMELSGLPPSSSPHFQKLKTARDAYKDFFGDNLPGTSYQHYDPPIPVEIEGSLFFDMSHSTGSRPGPKKLRDNMPTIWEVHPISKIVFEP